MPLAAPRPCPRCGRLIPFGGECPDHPKGWNRNEQKRGNRHERGYGNEWERIRKTALLRDKGLCVPCTAAGRITPASEVDHITPKTQGGTDALANLQSICRPCHKIKTAYENQTGPGVAQPDWLPAPLIPVVIICGAPGSGKLDYAKRIAEANDLVIDVDQIVHVQTGKPLFDSTKDERLAALRARNALLAGLAIPRTPWRRAVVTMVAGSPEQRQWWRDKLAAELIVLPTPKEECLSRVNDRQLSPVRKLELMRAIDVWR